MIAVAAVTVTEIAPAPPVADTVHEPCWILTGESVGVGFGEPHATVTRGMHPATRPAIARFITPQTIAEFQTAAQCAARIPAMHRRLHDIHQQWQFWLLCLLVLAGTVNRYAAVLECGLIGAFLLYSAPWVVRRALQRRNGVHVSIEVTRVTPPSRWWISIGGGAASGAPLRRAWCSYELDGQLFTGVEVLGTVPRQTGTFTALIDPAHPDAPYIEKSPVLDFTIWPVLLAGVGTVFIWTAVWLATGA